MTINNDDYYSLADVLEIVTSVALEGLKYAKDSYDISRYNKLLDLSSKTYSNYFELDDRNLRSIFLNSIGCKTPKCGAEAAIVNEHDLLLVLKRTDDLTWCLPCGWVDVDEDFSQAAVRETKEETGLDVTAKYYISLTKKGPRNRSAILNQINAIVLMEKINSSKVELKLSHEHSEYKWIRNSNEINHWHPNHKYQTDYIFRHLTSKKSNFLEISCSTRSPD